MHGLARLKPLWAALLLFAMVNGVVLAALNQPPVVTVPSPLPSGSPNTTIQISNSIGVSDPDAGGSDVLLSVTSTNGGFIWDYSTPPGSVETTSSATDDLAALNAALDGMVFVPNAAFAGIATMTLNLNDLGNTGTPPLPLVDVETFDIRVCAPHELFSQTNCEFNHAPFNVLPSPAPNAALGTTANIPVSVDDGDVGGGTIDMELNVQHHNGALLPAQVGTLFWTYGSNVTSDVATDTLANINAALANLTFTPALGFAGQARIVLESDDNGNSGSPTTEKADTDLLIIDVCAPAEPDPADCAANNAPANHLPNPAPDTTIGTVVSVPVSVSDIDVGIGSMDMEIYVQHHNGALPPASVGTITWHYGIGVTADLATDTMQNLNFHLNNLLFTPAAGFTGQARIVFEIDDNGNSGSLGPIDEKAHTSFVVIDVVQPSDPTFSAVFEGHGAPPNAQHIQTVDVSITPSGGGTPVFIGTRTTDTSGQFTVTNLLPGSYTVRVKGEHSLRLVTPVTLNAGSSTIALGTLREGDANDDNIVNIQDFSILASAFGTSLGGAGYNASADFNDDNTVNISDFSLLAANFGQSGAS
ncbi:MAG: hypothetical protein JNL42_06080 [Anaerolineae bacterium]|nr:hypothetical protein [Anaerolineae bacterium]